MYSDIQRDAEKRYEGQPKMAGRGIQRGSLEDPGREGH